jgi:hypothetical protein
MMKAFVVVALLAGVAQAEPRRPNLQITRDPARTSLRMRRAAQAPPTASVPPAAVRPVVGPMPLKAQAPVKTRTVDAATALRDLRQSMSFSVNLGYTLDGSRPSGRPSLDGSIANQGDRDFATLRSYGFGEGYASTRGVGISSLSTYFAARFQVARKLTAFDPDLQRDVPVAPPISTWFERSGTEVRSGWAELRDFVPERFGPLRRIRVRAGDQFLYSSWQVRMLGLNVAYEGPALSIQAFAGQRRSGYTRALDESQPQVAGGTIRVDLRFLSTPLPIALAASYLTLTNSDATGQPGSQSSLFEADWRPRDDVAVIASVRGLDGHVANQRLEVRARYKEVTNFVFDVMRRDDDDWRWDPTLTVRRQDDVLEARRYLDLGPVLPQLIGSVRGGTLIAENVDLLARVAGAVDLRDELTPANTFTQSYLEVGGALEVRLRRQAAVALSALTRTTRRETAAPIMDTPLLPDAIAASGVTGESGFTELGTRLRMTLGARRFSASLELYGRRTRFDAAYADPMATVPDRDLRGGGRLTVDAWLGPRVRLFAQYDASSEFDSAPEINGYRSLKLIASGVY